MLNSQSNRLERNEQNRSESMEKEWTERQMKKEEVMNASRESFIPGGMGWGGGYICSSFSGMSEREKENEKG